VQQKGCTGHAVVKSGKLYGVQAHVGQRLMSTRQCWRVECSRLQVIAILDK